MCLHANEKLDPDEMDSIDAQLCPHGNKLSNPGAKPWHHLAKTNAHLVAIEPGIHRNEVVRSVEAISENNVNLD